MISVGHRPSLLRYHAAVLHMDQSHPQGFGHIGKAEDEMKSIGISQEPSVDELLLSSGAQEEVGQPHG